MLLLEKIAAIDDIIRMFLCLTVLDVLTMRYVSLSLCLCTIKQTLYLSFSEPVCSIPSMNRPPRIFSYLLISYLWTKANIFRCRRPWILSCIAFLLFLEWYLRSDFNKTSTGNCVSGTHYVPFYLCFPFHA